MQDRGTSPGSPRLELYWQRDSVGPGLRQGEGKRARRVLAGVLTWHLYWARGPACLRGWEPVRALVGLQGAVMGGLPIPELHC